MAYNRVREGLDSRSVTRVKRTKRKRKCKKKKFVKRKR